MFKRSLFLPLLILSLSCTLLFSACRQQTANNHPHLSTGFKDSEASRITLEPLASFNEKGELVPFLAAEIPTIENGGVARDGKSVTWKLKKDIKWSDGTPFTAKDVIATYNFIL
ncbi:MAG: hypothetical protein RLZZ148_1258 [Cyanobacteriota bacterium]